MPKGQLLDRFATINQLIGDHGYSMESLLNMVPYEFDLTVMLVRAEIEKKNQKR